MKIPFNSSTTRGNPHAAKENVLLGPGKYIDINNPINSSVTKGILKFATDRGIMEAQGLTSGPFGSTERRFKEFAKAGPGPGEYTRDDTSKDELEQIYEKIAKPRSSSKSSVFSSKTERFQGLFAVDPFIQVVGTNPKEGARIHTTEMTVYGPPMNSGWVKQTRSVNPTMLGFNSAEPRWRALRMAHGRTPGPGSYGAEKDKGKETRSAHGRMRTPGSGMHSRADSYRPKTGTSNRIGPGCYVVDSTMIKKSFNMSLDNSFAYL